MTPGRFITLEGGEGVGKSTQAARLADAIRACGHDVVVTREPGGTPGAEAIRSLLMTGEANRWESVTEALLFAAARSEHVGWIIRPALKAGQWVVCDRFVDSTRAYQGALGVPDADIMQLHRIACDGLLPVRTLLLKLPRDEGNNRATLRDGIDSDRFAARATTLSRLVELRFEALANEESARIRPIDATGSPETVTNRLLTALEDLL